MIEKLTITSDFIDSLHANNRQAIQTGDVDIFFATLLESELRKLLGEPINAYTLSLAVCNAARRVQELTM